MGLGKTIQTLSLIAADLKASRICRELHQRSHQCSHCRQSSGPTFSSSSFSSSGSCSSSSAFSAYSSPCSVASRSANYSLAFPSLSGNRFGSASHPWARHLGGTLVIVPLSLVKQWREEVYVHMAPEAAVSVVAYSGQSRTRDGAELSKFDVVLTTYQTVAAEFPQLFFEQMNKQTNEAASTASAAQAEVKQDTHAKPKNRSKKSNSASFFKDGKGNYFSSSSSSSPSSSSSSSFSSSSSSGGLAALWQVHFRRIILDEAHYIKNRHTRAFRAVVSLSAGRRWCLTGTPIQNSLNDLFALVAFLGVNPYKHWNWWARNVANKLIGTMQRKC
eukprot:GHVT01061521.1.p1 GENE.GHVT01061521.1~~GHVT01061521.1.p1  ORF type:complete len:354 (+),score=84.76 GHVT01061521.1:71-1063(+)